MSTKKTLYLYRLTDARGDTRTVVVDDPSNDGCIGGYGADGKYHQYDSYELWHAYDWAKERGMVLESGTMEVEIPDDIFKPRD